MNPFRTSRHLCGPFSAALLAIALALALLSCAGSKNDAPGMTVTDDTPVADLLSALGHDLPGHFSLRFDSTRVRQGREIIFDGSTTDDAGTATARVSTYFVCTDCHNTVREDPDLRASDPDTRLDYVAARGIRFLPATTFFGMVDRQRWYNGDYHKKYGALVEPARDSIEAAIQLCALECSQGRLLADWEVDAVVAYLRTIGLRVGDLGLDPSVRSRLRSLPSSPERRRELIASIRSAYIHASPATFGEPPEDREAGHGFEGDPARGKMLFTLSCQACHRPGGPSRRILADTGRFVSRIKRNIAGADAGNFYQVIRQGTAPEPERRAYMPLYPIERMSDRQMEDLRAYIEALP